MHRSGSWLFKGLLVVLIVMPLVVVSQQNHYVYFQSDNKQPFYVKYKSKIISSSSTGYLILSKLNEADITIQLGFAQSSLPETTFQIALENSDKGFLVKEFPEKGWGLYDLQRLTIVYAQVKQEPVPLQTKATKDTIVTNDPFANMLSQVTQDSTVKQVTVQQPPPKQDTVSITTPNPSVTVKEKKDSIVVVPAVVAPPVVIATDSNRVAEVWQSPEKSKITQLRRYDSPEGSDYVFEVRESSGLADTIKVFISAPVVPVPAVPIPLTDTVLQPQKRDTLPELATVKTEPVIPEKKEVIVNPELKKDSIVAVQPVPKAQEPVPQPVVPQLQPVPNSNCKVVATEDDFLKLRRKMAQQSKEEQMVSEAKKTFRSMCFTSNQLKNLAVLFLSDEWRYRFYDAAFPFVTDFQNFRSLESTITDEYYKKRFQALIPTN